MTKNKNDFNNDLKENLKDTEYMELYINEVLDNYYEDKNIDILMHCLKPAIEAQGSIKAFAEKANIKREHLYKLFKREVKQPEFTTLSIIFDNLGLEFQVKSKKRKQALC